MANKKKKNGGRRRQKIPLAATIGMIAALKMTWDARSSPMGMMALWTGWDGSNWKWNRASALMAAGAGGAASMVAAKSGINRYIKIPFVKI